MAEPARRMHQGQGGFTMIEMLVVVALSGMIAIPVLAWTVVAFKTEATVDRTSRVTNATNMISQYLPRDVSGASVVSTVATNLCASPSEQVIVWMFSRDQTQLIAYVGVPYAQGRARFVRRMCTPTGSRLTETVLVENIPTPVAMNLTAAALTATGQPGDPANAARVDVSVTVRQSSPITVTASRRVGSDA